MIYPLDLAKIEWELFLAFFSFNIPFYLDDVFITHNKQNLSKLQFYQHFFYLQISGLVRVASMGEVAANGKTNITYTVTSFGQYIYEKYQNKKEDLDFGIGQSA